MNRDTFICNLKRISLDLKNLQQKLESTLRELEAIGDEPERGFFTFDNYIKYSGNTKAYDACLHATGVNRSSASPLIICGEWGIGIGKTHLLFSTKNYLEKYTDLKVLYDTGYDFFEKIRGMHLDSNKCNLNRFRQKYMSVDVLLIDDFREVIKQPDSKDEIESAVQDEFFRILSVLYKNKKTIIMTSDVLPSSIKVLRELFSRTFEESFEVAIMPPTYEERVSILMQLSKRSDYEMPYDIAEYIAQNAETNVPGLKERFREAYVVRAKDLNDIKMYFPLKVH